MEYYSYQNAKEGVTMDQFTSIAYFCIIVMLLLICEGIIRPFLVKKWVGVFYRQFSNGELYSKRVEKTIFRLIVWIPGRKTRKQIKRMLEGKREDLLKELRQTWPK